MNIIVRIISRLLGGVNGLLDGMNARTADAIKQGFFIFTALCVIGGIIIGYTMGKGAAKKSGTQIAEFTNDAFRIDLKRQREGGDFRSMLDSELIKEVRESSINKIQFPARSRLELETGEGLIEPDSAERKISPAPSMDQRDRLSEAERLDERRPAADVKSLRRRSLDVPAEEPGIIREERSERIIKERGLATEPRGDGAVSRDAIEPSLEKRAPEGRQTRRRPVLKPLEKNTGIIDK